MEKINLREWFVRVALLLLGLTIAHLGVTLFLQADMGSDPFNVLIQGLFRFFPWPAFLTHGSVHVGVSFLIILVLLVVDKSYIRIGTLLCMVLGGPIIDVFTLLLAPVVHSQSALALRLLALVLGCVILAFGMTIVIKSNAGTGPNDLVAVVISDKSGKKFGIIRIVVDVCFAGVGFALGGTLGVGTVICAGLVGPTAQLLFPFSERLCSSCLKTKV
ncbi:MAG: YitT family protein [Faecousia sp.]